MCLVACVFYFFKQGIFIKNEVKKKMVLILRQYRGGNICLKVKTNKAVFP